MTCLSWKMPESFWHAFTVAYGVINVPQFLNSALYFLIKGEETHLSDCFPEGGMMKFVMVCELEPSPTSPAQDLREQNLFHNYLVGVGIFTWENLDRKTSQFTSYPKAGQTMTDLVHSLVMVTFWRSKNQNFSHMGLIWHLGSHSNWNKVNCPVLLKISVCK